MKFEERASAALIALANRMDIHCKSRKCSSGMAAAFLRNIVPKLLAEHEAGGGDFIVDTSQPDGRAWAEAWDEAEAVLVAWGKENEDND